MAQNSVYNRQGTSGEIFILIAQVCIPFSALTTPSLLTLLQRFDVAAGEGDADAVNGDLSLNRCLTSVLESLHVWKQVVKTLDSVTEIHRISFLAWNCNMIL